MAVNQTNKRLNIVSNAIAFIQKYKDAVRGLQELQAEYATAGTFADAELLAANGTQHVSKAMVDGLFGGTGNVDTMTTNFNALSAALLAFLP